MTEHTILWKYGSSIYHIAVPIFLLIPPLIPHGYNSGLLDLSVLPTLPTQNSTIQYNTAHSDTTQFNTILYVILETIQYNTSIQSYCKIWIYF